MSYKKCTNKLTQLLLEKCVSVRSDFTEHITHRIESDFNLYSKELCKNE